MTDGFDNVTLISGPYRATKLWNAAVRAFHAGMPVSRHRRGLRVYDNCFSGAEAISWLHHHLTHNPNFDSSVTQEQTALLLKKFLKCGLLEDAINDSSSGGSSLLFKERGLYRFSSMSPLRALRTPGRHSLTELRASTRRQRALLQQKGGASPQLPQPKTTESSSTRSGRQQCSVRSTAPDPDTPNDGMQCNTQSDCTGCDHLGHVDRRDIKYLVPASRQQALKHDSQRALTENKENFSTLTRLEKMTKDINRTNEVKSSFRFTKRSALQSIENTFSVSNNSLHSANGRKSVGNVYMALDEVKRMMNKNNAKQNLHSCSINVDTVNRNKKNVSVNNAVNTLTEVKNGNEPNRAEMKSNGFREKCDRDADEKDVCKPRSRVKSFLIRSSGNSKYYNLLPKFGDNSTSNNSKGSSTLAYASSKTISPKLLHSVSMAQHPAATSNSLRRNFHRTENEYGIADSHQFTMWGNGNKKCYDVPKAYGEWSSGSELMLVSALDPELQKRLEQAHVEAWSEIMSDALAGCPVSLSPLAVLGPLLTHNQQHVTARGVVAVPQGHPDDLPHWLLAAMRFLAHWPASTAVDPISPGSIPNYPGVEVDVYRMVKDYFTHQKDAIIPPVIVRVLLEVLSAMEFLDLTLRDPKERLVWLSSRTRGDKNGQGQHASGKEQSLRAEHSGLREDLQRRSCAEAPTGVQEECLEDGVFATLPRASKGSSQAKSSTPFTDLTQRDSVEDLMLNMSMVNANLNNLSNNSSGGKSSEISHESSFGDYNRQDLTESLSKHCGKRDQCRNEDLGTHESGSRMVPHSPQSAPCLAAPADAAVQCPGDWTVLSTANISHVEHFKSNTSAMYVTGDDVRRRKKKRFFSKINKNESKGNEQLNGSSDRRRHSIYESIPKAYANNSGEGEAAIHLESSCNQKGEGMYSHINSHDTSNRRKRVLAATEASLSSSSLTSRINTFTTGPCKNGMENLTRQPDFRGSQFSLPPPYQSCSPVPAGTSVWRSGAPSWCDVSAPPSNSLLLRSSDIDQVALPPNSCFETAFTSDSPKTRIIPQKSVDTLHLRQLKRRRRGSRDGHAPHQQRPKSIAVPQNSSRYLEFGLTFPGELECDWNEKAASNTTLHYDSNWSVSPSALNVSSLDRALSVTDLAWENSTRPVSVAAAHSAPRMNSLDVSLNKSCSMGNLYDVPLGNLRQRNSTNDDFSSCAGDGVSIASKGFNLVHRVRDSIRRRKGKDVNNCKKHSRKIVKCNSSGGPSISSSTTSVNSSLHQHEAAMQNISTAGLLGDSSGNCDLIKLSRCDPVQFAKVVSSARGHEVHQKNIETLQRLRSEPESVAKSSASVKPFIKPWSGARSSNNHVTQGDSDVTKSNGFNNLGLSRGSGDLTESMSTIFPVVGTENRNIDVSSPTIKPVLLSPFAPSSVGERSDSVSMFSLSDFDGYGCDVTDACKNPTLSGATEQCCGSGYSPYKGSVTTTNYNTRLSTHYAANMMQGDPLFHQGVPASTTRSNLVTMTSPGCLSHAISSAMASAASSKTRSQVSTPVPGPASRSLSLSSLYTTALACYDESDPNPFTVTAIAGEGDGEAETTTCLGYDVTNSCKKKTDNHKTSCCHSNKCDCVRRCDDGKKVVNDVPAPKSLPCVTDSNTKSRASPEKTNFLSDAIAPAKKFGLAKSPSKQDITKNDTISVPVSSKLAAAYECTGSSAVPSRRPMTGPWLDTFPRIQSAETSRLLLSCVQLLLLLLQPVVRRRLHLLLRLLHKMAANPHLLLGVNNNSSVSDGQATVSDGRSSSLCAVSQSTRHTVLEDLGWCIARDTSGGCPSWRRLVSFLVDRHEDLMRPSEALMAAVTTRLRQELYSSQTHTNNKNNITSNNIGSGNNRHLAVFQEKLVEEALDSDPDNSNNFNVALANTCSVQAAAGMAPNTHTFGVGECTLRHRRCHHHPECSCTAVQKQPCRSPCQCCSVQCGGQQWTCKQHDDCKTQSRRCSAFQCGRQNRCESSVVTHTEPAAVAVRCGCDSVPGCRRSCSGYSLDCGGNYACVDRDCGKCGVARNLSTDSVCARHVRYGFTGGLNRRDVNRCCCCKAVESSPPVPWVCPSGLPRSNNSKDRVSSCVQVDVEEWEQQRSLAAQQPHLRQLLQQLVEDLCMPLEEKRKKIKQFAELYPTVYRSCECRVPLSLRWPAPATTDRAVKRRTGGGGVLRGMLRLASLSHLGKQRTGKA